MDKMKGIYIHIPFCKSKCFYCDFNSYAGKDSLVEEYVESLKKEIRIYSEKLRGSETIFFGGGTPSVIESKYIVEILEEIYLYSNRDEFIEITIEANPGTLNEEKLKDYKKAGINRISMGVQSLNDSVLKEIGRTHDRNTVLSTVEMVGRYFDNISIDMIFGLPDQTVDILESDLKEAVGLDIKHISFYALKIEEGTELCRREENGLLNLPDEEAEREMYHRGIEILKKNGFYQYEISNFAKENFQSKHNLIYWNVEPYIGLGLSAASNIERKRYNNLADFESYFRVTESGELPIDKDSIEEIDLEEEMSEYCILRLRLNDGIIKKKFSERFKTDIMDKYGNIIDKHIKMGLLDEDECSIKLTEKGFDLANQVYVDFLD